MSRHRDLDKRKKNKQTHSFIALPLQVNFGGSLKDTRNKKRNSSTASGPPPLTKEEYGGSREGLFKKRRSLKGK